MSLSLRRIAALSLTAMTIAALTSCASNDNRPTSTSSRAGYPFTINNCGRTYTYTQAPKRVVVGWPTTVDTLTALGLGSRVTGYLSSSFGPPPQGVNAKALSKDYIPSAETILGAQPDFFLANGDSQLGGERGGVTPQDLSESGASTYVMGNNCKNSTGGGRAVDTVYTDITNLGRIFDVPAKARALNSTLRDRVAAAAARRGDGKAPRIAYVNVTSGKLYALSGLSYAAQITGVGGVNVFSDLKQSFAEISPEKVLTLNADAIIFEYYTNIETAAQQKNEIVKRLSNSKAVHDGKIIGVPAYLSEGPGIAVIRAIETIAKDLNK